MSFPINWNQWISQNKKRIPEQQIIRAIKKHEAGSKVEDLCHEMCITVGNIYNCRSKYDGLEVNEAKRLKKLEREKQAQEDADRQNNESWSNEGCALKKVMTPAAIKSIAQHLIAAVRLSERVVCKLMGLNWTSLWYQPKKNADSSLRQRLKALAIP